MLFLFLIFMQIVSLHGRCKVFRGESTDSSKLLFWVKEVKESSKIPPGIIKLNVFLAKNPDENKSDFRVIIFGSKRSCTVYAGESPNIVAKVWVLSQYIFFFILVILCFW